VTEAGCDWEADSLPPDVRKDCHCAARQPQPVQVR
jgi:hypothetical protein